VKVLVGSVERLGDRDGSRRLLARKTEVRVEVEEHVCVLLGHVGAEVEEELVGVFDLRGLVRAGLVVDERVRRREGRESRVHLALLLLLAREGVLVRRGEELVDELRRPDAELLGREELGRA
jgi:hypothetical protein